MKTLKKIALVFAMLLFIPLTQANASSSSDFNFRFSPVLLLVGAMYVHLDYKLNDQWTLGPEVFYWNFDISSTDPDFTDASLKATGFGVRANWFKNGTYKDGLYIGPSVRYVSAEVSVDDSIDGKLTGEGSGTTAAVLIGYGWFWESFNQMLGGGIATSLGNTDVTVRDSSGNTEDYSVNSSTGSSLAIEYSIGWTF